MKIYNQNEVFELLRAEIISAGSKAAFAEKHELTPSYVGDLFHGRRGLSDKILEILQMEVRYIRRNGETKAIVKRKV